MRLGHQGLHHAQGEGRVQHQERRQHRLQGDVQAAGIGAQHRAARHPDAVPVDRAGRVAAQAQPIEGARHGEPVRVGRDQPQRHRPGRGQRPARPDVAVRLPSRRHPALPGVQPHRAHVPPPLAVSRRPVSGRGGQRRPEMAPRTGLGEGQRADVIPFRDGPPDRRRPVGLDDGGRRVVHEHHHRRGPAGPGEVLDDVGAGRRGSPRRRPAGHSSGRAGRAQRLDRGPRIGAGPVDLRRSGRHDLLDHAAERHGIVQVQAGEPDSGRQAVQNSQGASLCLITLMAFTGREEARRKPATQGRRDQLGAASAARSLPPDRTEWGAGSAMREHGRPPSAMPRTAGPRAVRFASPPTAARPVRNQAGRLPS